MCISRKTGRIRRYAYAVLLLLGLSFHAGHGLAGTQCIPTVAGTLCTASVDVGQFATEAVQSQQEQSQWCWAASISMLFAYSGHPVNQTRIVTETYGAPINIPSPGIVMANQLNRDWVDDNGKRFSPRVTGLYDSDAGIYGLTNNEVIRNLDEGYPLVIGARSHAVVLVSVDYYQAPGGPAVVGARVFDPWPGIGYRALDPDELVTRERGGSLRFAATVDPDGEPAGSGASSDDGDSEEFDGELAAVAVGAGALAASFEGWLLVLFGLLVLVSKSRRKPIAVPMDSRCGRRPIETR